MAAAHGRLVAVAAEVAGDELVKAPLAGTLVLTVGDVADFDEDGGWLRLAGTPLEYVSADDDAATITLALPLPVLTFPLGAIESRVDVWDPDADDVVVEFVARVVLDNQDEGEPVEAGIDHALIDLLPGGIRTRGESVSLEWDGDDLRVVEVAGKRPTASGTYASNPNVLAFLTTTTGTVNNTWKTMLAWSPFATIPGVDLGEVLTNGKFRITADGFYDVRFGVTFDLSSVGSRAVRMRYVTAAGEFTTRAVKVPGEGTTAIETAQMMRFVAGDVLYFEAWQNSGGALSVLGGTGVGTTASIMRFPSP